MFTFTLNERETEKSKTKLISIHSNRGGVGKTLIAINLAIAYANLGRSVCLIDLDFRAPSLSTIFQIQQPNLWINDFFDDNGTILDALIEVTHNYDIDGKLWVGLASPSLNYIRNMASKDKRWEMKMFRKLLSIKEELAKQNIEYVILDASPGILYSSVNAVACSDIPIIVTTADMVDTIETQRMITELYGAFEKSPYIFMNKFIPIFNWKETEKNTILKKYTTIFNAQILSIVPCYCELLNSSRKTIYTYEHPQHPFSKAIYDIANKLSAL